MIHAVTDSLCFMQNFVRTRSALVGNATDMLLDGPGVPIENTNHSNPDVLRSDLYFGLPTNDTVHGIDQFQEFVDNVVTPLFPDGLTWELAHGQYKSIVGRVTKENSIHMIMYHNMETSASVSQVAAAYAEEFTRRACWSPAIEKSFISSAPIADEFIGTGALSWRLAASMDRFDW